MDVQAESDSEQNRTADPLTRALNESAMLLRANRPGEAIALLLPLEAQQPGLADVAINLGGAYILQRKWDRAVRYLEQAARNHPANAMVWTNLAAAHLGQLERSGPRQRQRAIAAYERALQADPAAPNVHYHLGLVHKQNGNWIRASVHFQRALETNPADRDASFWLERMSQLLRQAQESAPRPEAEDAEGPPPPDPQTGSAPAGEQ